MSLQHDFAARKSADNRPVSCVALFQKVQIITDQLITEIGLQQLQIACFGKQSFQWFEAGTVDMFLKHTRIDGEGVSLPIGVGHLHIVAPVGEELLAQMIDAVMQVVVVFLQFIEPV